MGRMLDSLKFMDSLKAKDSHFFEDSLERDPTPMAPVQDDAAPESALDVPFIEVGPNKSFDGSPQVLAAKAPKATGAVSTPAGNIALVHPPQPTQPPHQIPAATAVKEKPIVLQPGLNEPKPMQVAFEAWPTAMMVGGSIAPEVIVHHQPEHAISKQYDALLGTMLDGVKVKPPVLLFTGGKAMVGATTVLLNLAVSAARGQRGDIIVVDGHLKKPGLAGRLGLAPAAGIQEVLNGKLALEQAIVKTPISHLHLLPAQMGNDTALSLDAARWMMSWLKGRFDLVLIDGPGADAGPDLAPLIAASDGMYLVLPQGENPAVQRSLAQSLSTLGGRLRGVVHTHLEM